MSSSTREKKEVKEKKAFVNVFTDGSALGNSEDSPSGSAVWFPELKILLGKSMLGTNNQAELEAMRMCLSFVFRNIPTAKLTIYSDSDYTIKAVTGVNKAKANVAKIVVCQKLLKDLRGLGTEVSFVHVDAHTSDSRRRPTKNSEYMTVNNQIVDKEAQRRAELAKTTAKQSAA